MVLRVAASFGLLILSPACPYYRSFIVSEICQKIREKEERNNFSIKTILTNQTLPVSGFIRISDMDGSDRIRLCLDWR